MSSGDIKLPDELAEACTRERGFSFLVRGDPGSGKTILMLSVCKLLKGFSDTFYVTSRVTADELVVDYPLAREALDKDKLIDATESKAETKLEMMVSLRMYDKPSFLQTIYSFIKKSGKPATVIVDSLEALKFALKMPQDDMSLEEALIDISRETSGKIFFVMESSKRTVLDYMVDGIITLQKSGEGRLIRTLRVEKMRGIPIRQQVHLFTLRNGVFQAIESERFSLAQRVARSDVKPSMTPCSPQHANYISTGIKGLDELLGGGYLKGSFNLIEIKGGVGERYDYLYIPTIVNHILKGGSIAIIPPGGTPGRTVMNLLFRLLPEEQVERRVIVGDVASRYSEEAGESVVPLKGEDIPKDFSSLLHMLGEREGDKIIVVGMDTLEHLYGLDQLALALGEMATAAKRSGIVEIGLVKYGQAVIDALNHLADTHMRVENVEGTVVAYGVIPHTPAFSPRLTDEKGLNVEIIPIV
nr:gas vesicle protein GvpD [Candidatus Freyrarchaeum guaymaensis]